MVGKLKQKVDVNRLPVVRFQSLETPGLVHGVTTRTDQLPLHGNMSYMVGDAPELVRCNRQSWAAAVGYDPDRLVLGRQVHETRVVSVDAARAGAGSDSVETSIKGVDGLMTSSPDLPIGVMAADCVPILMYDPGARAIAAVHAGWRGTVAGIAVEAVGRMKSEFGTRPEEIIVALGPSICPQCYQVGEEVVERWQNGAFRNSANAVAVTSDGFHFDLRAANLGQLESTGVRPPNVEMSQICTRCANGSMFSRRGLGPRTGLFAAIIMLSTEEDGSRNGQK